ncbi:NUDIX hydrolase [Massilia yuzhufengensis]|uniref:ADP-ribose pyrophosphatase YjhB, NUDIX family n=1 Tax=Massilia yuzhufengensis TaxID=1164594 RepID=A0A1I1GM68_9BURK|nr:NUDIX hydrolase [Massilia yuzhufengensis]SFC12704.1 ADP-ribose pyrophosphatase YjhB, NUDIX family [Massilia yuzhufengensis]
MTLMHPKRREDGSPEPIHHPSLPSPLAAWLDPAQHATVLPEGPVPAGLNGIPFTPWQDAPHSDAGWANVAGQDGDGFTEPAFVPAPGKRVAAGVVIEEADGRVWVVHPTNGFGGYPATFPKGTQDSGVPMRATAIREAFEECGLQVVLTGFLADVDRSRSKTRYYLGRRVGGCPAQMCWESQAVSLVPRAQLAAALANQNDAALVALLQAAPGSLRSPR